MKGSKRFLYPFFFFDSSCVFLLYAACKRKDVFLCKLCYTQEEALALKKTEGIIVKRWWSLNGMSKRTITTNTQVLLCCWGCSFFRCAVCLCVFVSPEEKRLLTWKQGNGISLKKKQQVPFRFVVYTVLALFVLNWAWLKWAK